MSCPVFVSIKKAMENEDREIVFGGKVYKVTDPALPDGAAKAVIKTALDAAVPKKVKSEEPKAPSL